MFIFDSNYHGFRLISIKLGKNIILQIERTIESICPICKKHSDRYDGKIQKFYIGNINNTAIYAEVKIYRIKCTQHNILTEEHGISKGKKRYTEEVAKNVISYTKLLDNKSTSKLLGISPSTVYRIDREKLSEMFEIYK